MRGAVLYNYISLLFFSAFAILIPASLILTSRMMRKKSKPSKAKNSPYESGEKSTGGSRDIDTEYFPFFMIFLPFEIVTILVLLWSVVAGITPHTQGLEMLGIVLVSTAFAVMGYKLISGPNA